MLSSDNSCFYWYLSLLCLQCRITGVKEDTSQGPNCGMYSLTGYVSASADGSMPNITVQVAGLYDVTKVLNACTVQAK